MTVAWTLGAFELGVLFASVLYGIVLSQAFTYTQEKFKDPIWLKIMVTFVCLVDTLHTVGIWSLLYEWSSHDFGNVEGLKEIPWEFILTFAVSPVENCSVQAFFAYRMFKLLTIPILPIIIWAGCLARFAIAIFRVVIFARFRSLPRVSHNYSWVLISTLSINVGMDTLNTVGLYYCLRKHRSGIESSQKVVDSLIRYTVEIGLITCICAIIILGLVRYRAHDNYIFLAFFAIYPKLFANSFLASLNARAKLRRLAGAMTEITTNPDYMPETKLLDIVPVRRPTMPLSNISPSNHSDQSGTSERTLPC